MANDSTELPEDQVTPGILQRIIGLSQTLVGSAANPVSNHKTDPNILAVVDQMITEKENNSSVKNFVEFLEGISTSSSGIENAARYRMALASTNIANRANPTSKELLLKGLAELSTNIASEQTQAAEGLEQERKENVTVKEARAKEVRNQIEQLGTELKTLEAEITSERARIDQNQAQSNETFEAIKAGVNIIQSGISTHL